MLPVDDIREKLLTQRRNPLRQVAQIEAELLWLEPDVESGVQEQGEEESLVQLLDRLHERIKAEIEVIDRALVKLGTAQYGRCEQCGQDIQQSRSLSDIDRSTATNDPRPSASFSSRKNPQRIPANTLRFFRACGLAFARPSFGSLRRQYRTGP
jgi:RNA polymerase-binding transcription factor DksA